MKEYRLKSEKEKDAYGRSTGYEAQASSHPLSMGSHGWHSVLPAMMCHNTFDMLPLRQDNLSIDFQDFYRRLVT